MTGRARSSAAATTEAAAREIALYFTDAELCPSTPTLAPWLKAADEA